VAYPLRRLEISLRGKRLGYDAVGALTPFITVAAGKRAFSYATAISGSSGVSVPTTGGVSLEIG